MKKALLQPSKARYRRWWWQDRLPVQCLYPRFSGGAEPTTGLQGGAGSSEAGSHHDRVREGSWGLVKDMV